MFLLDTHTHTSDVSLCSQVTPEQLVEDYIAAGYAGVIITNHYSSAFYDGIVKGETDEARIAALYLSGYRRARAAAGNRLDVLLGMEIRFPENDNDYLVFGMTEEFVEQGGNLMKDGAAAFSKRVRAAGMLFFQAHPFRNNMTVMPPEWFDGTEVYNGCVRHDSRNDIAAAWAAHHRLLASAGSDYHQMVDCGRAGIVTEQRLTDNAALVACLRSGAYSLYYGDTQD